MNSIRKIVEDLRRQLTKIQPILLWLVSAWLAYRLVLNGIRKFDPEGMWTSAFEEWGYPVWFRIFIGILETGGGLLVLIPKIRHYGGLILFAVMIGALITRIVNGTSLGDALSITYYALFFLYLVTDHKKK